MWRKPGVTLLITVLMLFSTFGSTQADAPLIRGAVDIIFVIDASGSMDSIISQVKQHTAWFAQEVQRRGYDYRLGLVAFADTSGYLWPPRWYGFTTNVNTFIGWVNGLSTYGGAEPTTRALEVALQAFLNEGRSSAGRMIILVTDENIQTNSGPSVSSIAKSLGQANVITNIIAYDSGNSATIHKETRGKFYNAGSSGSGIRPAYEDILNQIGLNRSPVISNVSYTPQNPFLNNNVTLIAYASDPDGDPLVYTWTARKPNGQFVTLGQGSSLTFKPDVAGIWEITVTVNDTFGAQDSRTITIAVGAYDLSAALVPEQVTRGQRVKVIASLTVPGTSQRTTADHIYLMLPNGQQIGMNWDSVLSRYWAEFLVPETGWARDGTHTLRVVAVKYGVEKSVTLSLVVRGNIKENLYIRQIIF